MIFPFAAGLDIVKDKKMSEPDPLSSGAYKNLPKRIEEQVNASEARQTYLKDSGEERKEKFDVITPML